MSACRYEELGKDGFHSVYRWYQQFEAQHFPDPAGLRESIAKYTLHLYPGVLKAAMAVFDVPEAIAVTRTAMCSGSMSSLTRLQVSVVDPAPALCGTGLALASCGPLEGSDLVQVAQALECSTDLTKSMQHARSPDPVGSMCRSQDVVHV